MPIIENVSYMGKTLDELAAIVVERKVNVSFFTPRKLPFFYKLYEKCGGDLMAAKEKNYAKEPRHLVLLRGFALQERPLTPKPVPSNNFRFILTIPYFIKWLLRLVHLLLRPRQLQWQIRLK